MLEDNQNEIAARMKLLIQTAKKERSLNDNHTQNSNTDTDCIHDIAWMPDISEDEFVISMMFDGVSYTCCIQEPTWREAASIELYAFRKTSDGRDFFAGEYERRELLKKSLKWIANIDKQEIHHIGISKLSYEFVELMWERVSKRLFVQLDEAQALYSSAKSFFSGETGIPVHPIILDVDGLIKKVFVFNASEWRAVKMSDYERYQIVWMAYYGTEMDTEADHINENMPNESKIRALLKGAAKQ